MEFREYSIDRFLSELSSDAPSPGGGSTAALVAALAASLNSMVYSLTVNKKAFENLSDHKKDEMIIFQDKARKFTKLAQSFMEKDRIDFTALMDSYKLPKDSEDEKLIRSKVIKEKTYSAMESPLDLARECLGFYENIIFAVEFGNKNLISDAGVAAILLHAAIESAILNVKINLNSLRKEEYAKEVEKECITILETSLTRKTEISIIVDNVIYPQKH
ncbi:MAG: cyclodeaminase/cyclohydrolase family protein [Clostridium sp.]